MAIGGRVTAALVASLLFAPSLSASSVPARLMKSPGSLGTTTPPRLLCELYAPQQDFDVTQEPQVRVGIVSHAREVHIETEAPVELSWVEFGSLHRSFVPQGTRLTISIPSAPQPFVSAVCRAPVRGMIQIVGPAHALHFADSLITLTPKTTAPAVRVQDVPFGMGYAWAGSQTRTYRGSMHILLGRDGALEVVNALGIEDVLLGVVPGEMQAQSPEHALRAQAIAARNFMVTGLGRRHPKEPFDFCAEQHCQVYQGQSGEHPACSQAVHATRGEVLMHGQRFVDAKYSARCGGHTENNEVVWPENPDPALRGRSDLRPSADQVSQAHLEDLLQGRGEAFCDPPTGSRSWQKDIPLHQIQALVAERGSTLGHLLSIRAEGRGPGGRLGALIIEGERGQMRLERELPIRRAFGNLRSGAFEVVPQKDAMGTLSGMTLRGVGWGHGVGLCQQGAIGRAQAGHSCGTILHYYYNGAHVVPLWTQQVVGCPSRQAS